MNQEQQAMFLSSAMNQYIFNKIFEDHNDGKIFNAEKWLKDVEELTSDSLFSISQEKQEKLAELITNLDKYAGDADDDSAPVLKLK